MKIKLKTRSVTDGFTFIELCIVVIILGIIIAITLPNFRRTFNGLQLNSFSSDLQNYMRYLRERSIVSGKIIYLNIDTEKHQYTAQFKDVEEPFKMAPIPEGISIDVETKQIAFYPDGQIDKVTVTLINTDNQKVSLTTKGIFGGVKVSQEK